ncbi:unnamed protein product [Mytilus coruscus]|uniref:Uncharacterized protein n=1 Tax=Mytilus coruscus TaxID=42192 RepID=A0A6J8A7W9_MYTCO|nr:unnamed protein product [Mytilus coruscus]
MSSEIDFHTEKRIKYGSNSMCVRGAAFSGTRTPTKPYTKSEEFDENLVSRSVSFTKSRSKILDNSGNSNKESEDLRLCKSGKVSDSFASRRKKLKRSKSDASLKINKNLTVLKTSCSNDEHIRDNDDERSVSALKRRESYTRREILSDQCAVDSIKPLSKFKLDVKIGVRDNHYNQWARSKRSVSLSVNSNVNRNEQTNQSSPPNTPKLQDKQRRILAVPRKSDVTRNTTGILNFDNFDVIFQNIPVNGNLRISPKKKASVENSLDLKKIETSNVTNLLQVEGARCKSDKDDSHYEMVPIPKISVGNVLEYTVCKKKFEKSGKLYEPCEHCKATASNTDDHLNTKSTCLNKSTEIDAVLEANSSHLRVHQSAEFDKHSHGVDVFTVYKEQPIEIKTLDIGLEHKVSTPRSSCLPIPDDDKLKSKVPLTPMRQDVSSNFELDPEKHQRFVITNDLHRLSKNVESSKDQKMIKDHNSVINQPVITEEKRVVTPRGKDAASQRGKNIATPRGKDVAMPRGKDVATPRGKDEKPVKIPLKLAMKTPNLGTLNIENNFAQMRIEQHLNNLRIRTESQMSARNTPVRENVPSPREGGIRDNNENCHKQANISLNDQADFSSGASLGRISVKIQCSSKNMNKLRNTNKISAFIPLRGMSVERKIWNLHNI